MYHFIIFIFGLTIVTGGFKCCKKEIFKLPEEEYKECFKLDNKPLIECKVTECIAKQRGHRNDDGTFNYAKMMEDIEKDYKNDPELVDILKEKCIARDLNNFGLTDVCDLMKIQKCFEYEIIKSCNTWSNEGECAGMKKTAALCVKQYY